MEAGPSDSFLYWPLRKSVRVGVCIDPAMAYIHNSVSIHLSSTSVPSSLVVELNTRLNQKDLLGCSSLRVGVPKYHPYAGRGYTAIYTLSSRRSLLEDSP